MEKVGLAHVLGSQSVLCKQSPHLWEQQIRKKQTGSESCACKLPGAVIGNKQLNYGVSDLLVRGESHLRHISQLPTKDTWTQQQFFLNFLFVINVASWHICSLFHLFLCSCSRRTVWSLSQPGGSWFLSFMLEIGTCYIDSISALLCLDINPALEKARELQKYLGSPWRPNKKRKSDSCLVNL